MLSLVSTLLVASVPCSSGATGQSCVVETKIGYAKLPMVMDTGADLTVLTKKGAERAGIRVERDTPRIVVQGAGGKSVGYLVRAKVQVGNHREDDVLVAVMPALDIGRAQGLLGMSFLERFHVSLGSGNITLTPIDAKDPEKRGGHGKSWWQLRFRENRRRLEIYNRLMPVAKKLNEQIEAAYGKSADGENVEKMAKRLRDFMEEEATSLANDAGRHAVPHEWRR